MNWDNFLTIIGFAIQVIIIGMVLAFVMYVASGLLITFMAFLMLCMTLTPFVVIIVGIIWACKEIKGYAS